MKKMPKPASPQPLKKRPGAADSTPGHITDHPFLPKAEWYGMCGHRYDSGTQCNLGEAAHASTTLVRNERGEVQNRGPA